MVKVQADDWNHFWGQGAGGASGKISWSKRRMLKLLDPFLIQGKSALDAGCGSGFFSRIFCEKGLKTVSVDYSDAALGMTRESTQGHSRIVKADLLKDGLPEKIVQRFDLIFSDGLFEHFSESEQNKILSNLVSVLKDDGILMTFVPNRWSPWQWIRPFFMPGIEETPFLLSELTDLHKHNGMHVLNSGGINVFPWRISPEILLGHKFGMLLYVIARLH